MKKDGYELVLCCNDLEEFNMLRNHMLEATCVNSVPFIISGPKSSEDPTNHIRGLMTTIDSASFNIESINDYPVKPKKLPYTKNRKWYQQFDKKRF